jgi:chromosome segregation ATPase
MGVKGLISKNAKKVSKRAKKISQGIGKTTKQLTSAIGKFQRSAEIVEELAFIDISLIQIKNYEFPIAKNKINNDPLYLTLDTDTPDESQAKTEAKLESLKNVEEFYNKKIDNFEKQKKELKDEYKKLNDNYFGLKKTEEEKKLKIKNHEKDEKQNQVKNKRKFTYTGIVSTLSYILSILLEFISINNTRIEELVDKTNEVISKATTKEDIDTARSLRNRAISIINTNKNQIEIIKFLIEKLKEIISTLGIVIELLSILPATFMNASIILKLQKLQTILNDSVCLLDVSISLLIKLIQNLEYQESRLLQLNDILDSNFENLTSDDILSLLNSNRFGLGYLKGFDYKGFKFFIKEENNPNFVVKNNKRRYATAVNKDGNNILQSLPSFTLEPDVLVEELKLQIDQKGLVA